jgi:hypothetical protein
LLTNNGTMAKIAKALVAVFLVGVPACAADRLLVQLRTTVNAFAIEPIAQGEPSRVLFTSEQAVLTVSFIVANAPGDGDGPQSYELTNSPWWRGLSVHLEKESKGAYAPIRFSPGDPIQEPHSRVEQSRTLRSGDRVTARFALPSLDPGVYHLFATLGSENSDGDLFRVTSGDENDAMRIAYARFKIEMSRDRNERRRYLRKLAELDPLNAGAWIELGDLSLVDGSFADVQKYYESAIRVLDERRKLFASRGANAVVEGIDGNKDALRRLQTILPQYFARREALQLSVDVHNGKRYVLTERATGRVVAEIRVRQGELR